MHVLMQVQIPHEPFNTYVREGVAGEKIGRILESIQPEAAYFTTVDGKRGGVFVVELDDMSDIPSLAEPFFLTFNADVSFKACMTPDELGKAGLEELGQTWS